jgi:hypothetical protein
MRREEGAVEWMVNSAVWVDTGFGKVRSSGSTVTDVASPPFPFPGIPGCASLARASIFTPIAEDIVPHPSPSPGQLAGSCRKKRASSP